ncbi:MAG: hypothetical protein IPM64_10675 [Phycisphaerales bacterium]|nr:hypothetical protein [Phycisphaerales bacterium]
MPANVFMNRLELDSDWKALAEEPTVVNATIITPAGNSKDVAVRFRQGDAIGWPPGVQVQLDGVDLAELDASCDTSDNVLLVVGYTR